MPSLQSFLSQLNDNEILRISDPINLDYIPTSLALELEKQNKFPVLYFENPIGFDMPVIANLFAERNRIAKIVSVKPEDFNNAWIKAERNLLPPRIVSSGPVKEVIHLLEDVDASQLPISRHFQEDAGRYIGSGILVCKDPDTGVRNLSYQRLLLQSNNKFGASLHSRGHIWEHLNRVEKRGQNLEVAVVIGAHPAIYLAASAKVAMEVDEYEIAGALLGEPLELVKCETINIEVPSEAEIVLEGELLANIHEPEGPYGEYTGYSTYRSTNNVFEIKAIIRRRKPIYLDIIPGYSMEHLLLSRSPRVANVFSRLREAIPSIREINYPKSGTHYHAYISMKKTSEGQARQALMLLFGLDPYVKFAVTVDEDIDVFNEEEVLWAIATRFQADQDMFVVPKVICNRLDPSSNDGMSAKMGLDATAPLNWDVERTKLPVEAVEEARRLINKLSY